MELIAQRVTVITETPQEDRPTYTGKVYKVFSKLYDEALVSEDNPDGEVPDSFVEVSLPDDMVPQETGTVFNPGKDSNIIPSVTIAEGKTIKYVIAVVIDEDI